MSQNPFHGSSSELVESVLNNAPASIIVCSAESRVLLYANERARKLFLKKDYRPGITCYEAAGRCRPCPSASMRNRILQSLLCAIIWIRLPEDLPGEQQDD